MKSSLLLSAILLLLSAPMARADKITLKDGTVLDGTAIKSADGYWFKGSDGQRRQIPESDIKSIERGTGGSTASPGLPGPTPRVTGSIDSVRARSEQVTTPVAAVSIWQEFIDSKPSADDLKVAKQELEKWKTLEAEKAQKVKGRWVGGDELKTILREWKSLHEEGLRLMHDNQTLAGPGVKITRGIVTSNTPNDEHPGYEYDIMVDAKVNPGNSGGPILDKYGNVMAIVSLKSRSSDMTDSFGLGISAGNIRKFLKKTHVAVPLGLTGPVALSTEDIVSRVKPATVCILSTR